ncbi:MAG: hypothetical protein GC165_12870 [Armatimonadetes bacterium]|nr:hypothetical protein [Armatimonadota bacterium]MBS1726025.1 hypothetical protein [Armatimonadota bacterium]
MKKEDQASRTRKLSVNSCESLLVQKRGRPKGSSQLSNQLVQKIAQLLEIGVRFPIAAESLGIPRRTAYSWRQRGERISVEFLDDIKQVPREEWIFLHFLHEIERAKSQAIVDVLKIARRKIRSTSDALKLLEYIAPEEFGPRVRKARANPSEYSLNEELCRIVKESNEAQARLAEHMLNGTTEHSSVNFEKFTSQQSLQKLTGPPDELTQPLR